MHIGGIGSRSYVGIFYDKYQTDVERENSPPKKVKKEDWEKFVNMCSMEASIAKRNHGKEARKALKSPHASGRMGQARVAENLVSTVLFIF